MPDVTPQDDAAREPAGAPAESVAPPEEAANTETAPNGHDGNGPANRQANGSDADSGLDDFAAALAEYDRATAKAENAGEAAAGGETAGEGEGVPDGPLFETPDDLANWMRRLPLLFGEEDIEKASALFDMHQQLMADDAVLSEREERFDFEHSVMDRVRADVPEAAHLPDAFLEYYFSRAYAGDERVREAWDNRSVGARQADRAIGKLVHQLRGELQASNIDPHVTADVDLVAAAVRGSSTDVAPEAPPPDYGHMSNQDFAQAVEDEYGFRPNIA